jgi:transcriptional regulator GlxA family with amidase domain
MSTKQHPCSIAGRSGPSPGKLALVIELLWSPQARHGVLWSVLDALWTMREIGAMREPGQALELHCRWMPGAAPSHRPPRLPPAMSPQSCSAPGAKGRRRRLPDLVVLPGWRTRSGPHLDACAAESAWALPRLTAALRAGAMLVCVDNAVVLPGRAGLLAGRDIVAAWPMAPAVLRACGDARLRSDVPWVADGPVWSCTSPTLATEVVLRALRATAAAELATSAAHVMLHDAQRQRVSNPALVGQQPRRVPAGAVPRALRWMETHLHEPLDLQALARVAATSLSTLRRHFLASEGCSPHEALRRMRVARARVLLETTYLTIEQVARDCGFTDVGTFRRVFREATGELPRVWRARHQLRTSHRRWSGPAMPA